MDKIGAGSWFGVYDEKGNPKPIGLEYGNWARLKIGEKNDYDNFVEGSEILENANEEKFRKLAEEVANDILTKVNPIIR